MTYENFCHWLHGFFSGVHGALDLREREQVEQHLMVTLKDEKDRGKLWRIFGPQSDQEGKGSCS